MKYILFLLLFHSYLLALINEPIQTEVKSVSLEEESVLIHPVTGAQVGMYGVIVHHFNAKHATALSWVEITAISSDGLSAKMLPIYALEQSALPSGTWKAQAGDEVILGYNYHRSLLIAPNPSVYKKVTEHHKDLKWVHPDIFTTVLSTRGHPTPLADDFKYTCRANNIGLVSFMFDQSLLTIDCQSFKILQNKETSFKIDETQLPFYTRVVNIEENWFGEGSEPLTEYTPYYVALLAENNPDNEWIQNYLKTLEETQESDSWFSSWF